MNTFDKLTLLTFIALDIAIERENNIKLLYNMYYDNFIVEAKDVVKRLFK